MEKHRLRTGKNIKLKNGKNAGLTNGKRKGEKTPEKATFRQQAGPFLMKIIIETPKYSFWKYNRTEKGYERVFFSPLPTIFNYGFVEGTESDDGMEEDVVVLGPRLPKGSTLERETFDGVVRFLDNSVRDDKKVVYISGFHSPVLLAYYFRLYALFKIFLYAFRKGKLTKCRFEGIEFKKLS